MYTYLIGWTKHNKWYYGVRFSKKSRPGELWVTYFTSSKYVKEFAGLNGDPDVIQIRKKFTEKTKAIIWESTVLKRLDVVHNSMWLNRTDNQAIRGTHTYKYREPWNKGKKGVQVPWNKGLSTPRTKLSIEKQRSTMKGVKRGPYANYKYKTDPILFRGKEYRSIESARKDTGASFYTIKSYATSA